MKKINLLLFISILAFSSCKKEGCTDTEATNYNPDAKRDDGTCRFAVDDFVGIYNISENFTTETCGNGSDSYLMYINYYGNSKSQVTINNLAGGIDNVLANINGNSLTIPTQLGKTSDDGSTWDISDVGNSIGVLNGTVLTLNYVIDDLLYNNDCGEVNGECTGVKQ